MKVININNRSEQGKRSGQTEYSEMITYFAEIAFTFGLAYLLVTDRIKSLTIQQRADIFISFANYFCLLAGAISLAWIGFDKQIKVGKKVRIAFRLVLIIYIIGSVYYLFGVWWALYSFGVIVCFMFIYGAGIANKAYDEQTERELNLREENIGIDTGMSIY